MSHTYERLLATAKLLVKEIGEDDVSGLAAEMAYRLLLAMFPFFIFLAATGAFVASALNVDNPTERIMDSLGDALPSDASSVLRDQLEQVLEERNAGLLSVSIVAAVWAASGAMNTLIKAFNRVYDVPESRPFWKRYLMAVALTLLSGIFFTTAFTVLIIGQLYAQDIADQIGLGGLARTLLYWGRFPFATLLLLIAVSFLNWAAPNREIPFRWVSPGAVLFIVTWMAFTVAFGSYVANFGSYNSTYGTLGGVVVLMVWLYLSSFIMLAAAELNAVLETAPVEGVGEQPRAAAGRRRARMSAGAATVAIALALAGLAAWRALRAQRADSHTPRSPESAEEEGPALSRR